MKAYKFPPIYRAVGFSAGGKAYLLCPANNTVIGPQTTPDTHLLSQILEATAAHASLPNRQDENSRSHYQPQSQND